MYCLVSVVRFPYFDWWIRVLSDYKIRCIIYFSFSFFKPKQYILIRDQSVPFKIKSSTSWQKVKEWRQSRRGDINLQNLWAKIITMNNCNHRLLYLISNQIFRIYAPNLPPAEFGCDFITPWNFLPLLLSVIKLNSGMTSHVILGEHGRRGVRVWVNPLHAVRERSLPSLQWPPPSKHAAMKWDAASVCRKFKGQMSKVKGWSPLVAAAGRQQPPHLPPRGSALSGRSPTGSPGDRGTPSLWHRRSGC